MASLLEGCHALYKHYKNKETLRKDKKGTYTYLIYIYIYI